MGHSPGTNHLRMMVTLHEAARRGVPIIVFNPLRERRKAIQKPGTLKTFLLLHPSGEVA
jgi:anaerobic selenocysteine-containing dehydrogenase